MGDKNGILFAAFFEAHNGTATAQWMVFPPALEEFGAPAAREWEGRFIKRRRDSASKHTTWSTTQRDTPGELDGKLKLELSQYDSSGWTLLAPIVIELELDDYEKVWSGTSVSTPYKALRHVDAVAKKRGYRI